MLALMAVTVLAGTVAAQQADPVMKPVPRGRLVTWQGEYVGLQRIADTRRPFDNSSYAVTFLSIVGVGKKNSIQFQLIVPVFAGLRAPIYRIAIDRRIF